MVDVVTLNQWRIEFCLIAATGRGTDLACTFASDGSFVWHSPETSELWHFYKKVRGLERHSIVTVPVVTATDWREVNTAARGG